MSIIFKRQKYSIYLNGRRMPFGQLVIGAPGAGKTTYCAGMQQFLSGLGRFFFIFAFVASDYI